MITVSDIASNATYVVWRDINGCISHTCTTSQQLLISAVFRPIPMDSNVEFCNCVSFIVHLKKTFESVSILKVSDEICRGDGGEGKHGRVMGRKSKSTFQCMTAIREEKDMDVRTSPEHNYT